MPSNPKTVFKLRPLEKTDLVTLTRWFQDVDDLARFDRISRVPQNQYQVEENWSDVFGKQGDCCKFWFMVENAKGEPVGMSGLEALSQVNRDAIVAMFVDKSARRKGVGIRATALMVDFAFRQLGLNRLTSYCRADNQNSRDLVGRLGFQEEGTMRQAWFADGQFFDMVVVGLLRQDWLTRRVSLTDELCPETVATFGHNSAPGWMWPPRGT